jgi:hypothetical protein
MPKPEQPGYYWVRFEKETYDWEVAQWNGKFWQRIGEELTFDAEDAAAIGHRIAPPADR